LSVQIKNFKLPNIQQDSRFQKVPKTLSYCTCWDYDLITCPGIFWQKQIQYYW